MARRKQKNVLDELVYVDSVDVRPMSRGSLIGLVFRNKRGTINCELKLPDRLASKVIEITMTACGERKQVRLGAVFGGET